MNCKIEKSVYLLEPYVCDKKQMLQGVLSGKIQQAGFDPESYATIGGHSISKFVEHFHGKKVWCIWAVNDTFLTPYEILVDRINKITGQAYSRTGAVYSELTGYLWTNDEGKIGGHDVTSNLASHPGKYGFLCIRENSIDLSKIFFE